MTTERPDRERGPLEPDPHGAGMPGEGAGQREDPGQTGVHPASAGWPEGDMKLVREGEWGQGDRGLAGYEDHGDSELSPIGLGQPEDQPADQPRSMIRQPDPGSNADQPAPPAGEGSRASEPRPGAGQRP